MASGQTENYGLNQWAAEDPVLREEFNADNRRLDELWDKKGNCRIAMGTYVGTGTYGPAAPNKLEFQFQPLAVAISGEANGGYLWLYGNNYERVDDSNVNTLAWSETSLTWYSGNPSAATQLNREGKIYRYIAFG